MVENKRKVTKALKNKKIDIAIDTNWPFIGPFLKFLEDKGVMDVLKKITGTQIRKMLGLNIYILLETHGDGSFVGHTGTVLLCRELTFLGVQ